MAPVNGCIEYEFTLPSGEKRYEFVDPNAGDSVMQQVSMFMKMHGAVRAQPVSLRLLPT
jgi:hypothetical protein